MALEDESHHAIAEDQQITVRCPLARPLQSYFPISIRGFTENNKSKMVTVKKNCVGMFQQKVFYETMREIFALGLYSPKMTVLSTLG